MPRRTKSPEGPRSIQLKFYITEEFRAELERFLTGHPELGSLGDLGHAALTFYMVKYREAGFHRDRHGFPAAIAAEHHAAYDARCRPDQKKQGNR